MPVASTLEPGRNYGIPPRTSASTTLWAHLLRKDTQRDTQKPDIPLPPITPLDKNGTSMRVLLHDTQAYLDKFSTRADSLLTGVDEAKQEISLVKTLFQREHDALTDELVDLVNRAQTQLQTSIGCPAQADRLDGLSRDFNMHLEALEKRLDAIQQIGQTQGQVLQLQSQSIQLLQEQQGSLLSTVLPLLPLLQALPLHIESARNKIMDMLTISQTSRSSLSEPSSERSSLSDRKRRKRSSSTLRPESSPHPAMHKKPRTISSTRTNGLAVLHDGPITSPLAVSSRSRADFGSSLRGILATNQTSSLTRQETTILPSSQTSPIQRPTKSPDADTTSRFFLNDVLSTEQQRQLSNSSPFLVPTSRANHVVCPMLPPGKNFETPVSGVLRPSIFSSPSSPRAPGQSLYRKSLHLLPKAIVPSLSPPYMQPTKVLNATDTLSHRIIGPSAALIGPACHPANHFTASNDVPHVHLWKTPLSRQGVLRPSVRPPFSPSRLDRKVNSTVTSAHATPTLARPVEPTPPVPELRIRERRSPLKEGRRFIPLDDSDDDVDKEMDS
ncbi:hypothetical protein H0H92_010881 [Tricholoma furcatifolium]|nr:hypothetical protein H0H92_010881 [Tricholoma furcatifolium]